MRELHIAGENAPPQTRECPSFQAQLPKFEPRKKAKFKWPTGGGNTPLQSSPSDNKGGIHIHKELRVTGAQTDSDYYNPNPWGRILGRGNEADVEIDGVISKA